MKKFGILTAALVFVASAVPASGLSLDWVYQDCVDKGYVYERGEGGGEELCVFNDGESCPAVEFSDETCGEAYQDGLQCPEGLEAYRNECLEPFPDCIDPPEYAETCKDKISRGYKTTRYELTCEEGSIKMDATFNIWGERELAPDCLKEFPDVSSSHNNYEAIHYLKRKEIISGYEDGFFRPENRVNRAELLKILVEGNGKSPDVEEYNSCFPDVQREWFAPYVCYAQAEGWVDGYPDGTFKPADFVNNVEAIKMLLNSQNIAVLSFTINYDYTDVPNDAWFTPYVAVADLYGILEEEGSTFGPDKEKTRGAISENLFRLLQPEN